MDDAHSVNYDGIGEEQPTIQEPSPLSVGAFQITNRGHYRKHVRDARPNRPFTEIPPCLF